MESRLFRWSGICLGGLLAGSVSLTVKAMDAGYIEAVKADMAEFERGAFAPPEGSTWLGTQHSDATQLVDLDGFSQFLQDKSPGSFIFYKKLPAEYKEQLHRDYLATGDLDRIKQDIFKYNRQLKH